VSFHKIVASPIYRSILILNMHAHF